jgi:hypothetical protein
MKATTKLRGAEGQVIVPAFRNGYPNGYPRFPTPGETMRMPEFPNECGSPDGIRTHDLLLERETP